MTDLLRSFSSSREHAETMQKSMNVQDNTERERVKQHDPEGDNEVEEMPFLNPSESLLPSQASEEKIKVHEAEEPDIPRPLPEQVVEFSITIVDPALCELTNETAGAQYKELTHNLRNQMLHVLDKLPGFKEIRILGFSRPGNVSVRYAAVFDTDVPDWEKSCNESTVVSSGPGNRWRVKSHLKDMVSEALRKDTSLKLDIHSLYFEPEHVTVISTLEEPSTLNTQGEPKATTEQTAARIEEGGYTPVKVGNSQEENDLEKLLELDVFKEEETEQTSVNPSSATVTNGNELARTKNVHVGQGYDLHTHISDTSRNVVNLSTLSSREGESGLYENIPKTVLANKVQAWDEPVSEGYPKDGTHEATSGKGWHPTAKHAEILPAKTTAESVTDSDASATQTAVLAAVRGREAQGDTGLKDIEQPSLTTASLPRGTTETMDYHTRSPAGVDRTFGRVSPSAIIQPGSNLTSESRELVVVFSLWMSNSMFPKTLLNKSSADYGSLGNVFLQVMQFSDSKDQSDPRASSTSDRKGWRTLASIPLLPYLFNMTEFKELEILRFTNGSVIVNSKLVAVPEPRNVTEAVGCVFANFCGGAPKDLDAEADRKSDAVDPCRFLACGEFSRCMVNGPSREAECVCDPGYSAVRGLSCQSVCSLQPDYCLNGGQCLIVPGHGAACRCPFGSHWHYHGERCAELVSLPVDPLLIIVCLVGFLVFLSALVGILVLINRKCIRTRKTVSFVHKNGPFSFVRAVRLNPLIESDDGTLTRVSSLNSTLGSAPGSAELSEEDALSSFDSVQLSIEIPQPMHTNRPDKLDPETGHTHDPVPFESPANVNNSLMPMTNSHS